MEDYYYKGYEIVYCPHPKLYGNYEIHLSNEFIGRAATKKEVKELIKLHFMKTA